jgi:hypothetical protein
VPRASELIKLGLAFSAAFGPFIVGVALAFWLLYSVRCSCQPARTQPMAPWQQLPQQCCGVMLYTVAKC